MGALAGGGAAGLWTLAALLASFYVNAASWMALAALLEKRAAASRLAQTAIAMPAGLIGGAETALLFALMLGLPGWARPVAWAMAAGVVTTAAQRVAWAIRHLPAIEAGGDAS